MTVRERGEGTDKQREAHRKAITTAAETFANRGSMLDIAKEIERAESIGHGDATTGIERFARRRGVYILDRPVRFARARGVYTSSSDSSSSRAVVASTYGKPFRALRARPWLVNVVDRFARFARGLDI